jgi:hypothetical protein
MKNPGWQNFPDSKESFWESVAEFPSSASHCSLQYVPSSKIYGSFYFGGTSTKEEAAFSPLRW